jgi:hypothetical protein
MGIIERVNEPISALPIPPVDDRVHRVNAHASDLARTSCSIRSHDLADTQLGGVDLLGVGAAVIWACITLVPQAKIGRQRLLADLGPVGHAAAGPLSSVGDEIDLHLGVGADDGADVPALDHGVPDRAELALSLPHHLAHLGVAGDGGDDAVDARHPDLLRDIPPADENAVALERDGLAVRELSEFQSIVEREGPLRERAR